MYTSKISRGRQLRFLAALGKSGNVVSAALDAHVDRAGLEETRRRDRTFAQEWEAAEQAATYQLVHEAWRRAMDGVPEPIISEGKVVRDDAGQPLAIQRYSDALLIELLRINRAGKYSSRIYWKSVINSPPIRRLALICLIILFALAIGGMAVHLLRNHLYIASFH